ncbi:rCG50999 [Rattus norvegicus]|uniref:RCG50999 n=1 Tax=Rattus norvegicus TaxID=10116 RepID=A6KGE7_RAT|nr:rCG50999 [Rattus norvegicus]
MPNKTRTETISTNLLGMVAYACYSHTHRTCGGKILHLILS